MIMQNSEQGPDEIVHEPNMLKKVEGHIQSKTLAGLIDLVPILVTIAVIVFLVEKTDSFVRPMPFVEGQPWDFPGIGLIVMIVLFYLIGLIISTTFGRRASGWKDNLFELIPVVRNVFGVTRQVITSFTSQYTFSRVVFLEWPREGMIAMGFVTGRAFSARTKDSMALVYVPTIPNPTSGNLALVMEDDLIETDLEVDDAMKLVFSGGIILPEALTFARIPREGDEQIEIIGRFESEQKG
ncbi:MAG: DUF502 domain-containing protein [Chloroflexi bacterium]|nr:DUF502 domain-containing protein [Chloroflexota bacterium]